MNWLRPHKGTRRWSKSEVEHGIWVSLGQDTPDGGITEVSPRKFVTFNLRTETNLGYPVIGGYSKRREFLGPATFDVFVIAAAPAGDPRDILRNSHRIDIGRADSLSVSIKWDGEKVNAPG